MGGLHLIDPSEEQMRGTLDCVKKLQPNEVHACHYADLNSKMALSKVVNLGEVSVGLKLEYK